jgi:hypothetical protein
MISIINTTNPEHLKEVSVSIIDKNSNSALDYNKNSQENNYSIQITSKYLLDIFENTPIDKKEFNTFEKLSNLNNFLKEIDSSFRYETKDLIKYGIVPKIRIFSLEELKNTIKELEYTIFSEKIKTLLPMVSFNDFSRHSEDPSFYKYEKILEIFSFASKYNSIEHINKINEIIIKNFNPYSKEILTKYSMAIKSIAKNFDIDLNVLKSFYQQQPKDIKELFFFCYKALKNYYHNEDLYNYTELKNEGSWKSEDHNFIYDYLEEAKYPNIKLIDNDTTFLKTRATTFEMILNKLNVEEKTHEELVYYSKLIIEAIKNNISNPFEYTYWGKENKKVNVHPQSYITESWIQKIYDTIEKLSSDKENKESVEIANELKNITEKHIKEVRNIINGTQIGICYNIIHNPKMLLNIINLNPTFLTSDFEKNEQQKISNLSYLFKEENYKRNIQRSELTKEEYNELYLFIQKNFPKQVEEICKEYIYFIENEESIKNKEKEQQVEDTKIIGYKIKPHDWNFNTIDIKKNDKYNSTQRNLEEWLFVDTKVIELERNLKENLNKQYIVKELNEHTEYKDIEYYLKSNNEPFIIAFDYKEEKVRSYEEALELYNSKMKEYKLFDNLEDKKYEALIDIKNKRTQPLSIEESKKYNNSKKKDNIVKITSFEERLFKNIFKIEKEQQIELFNQMNVFENRENILYNHSELKDTLKLQYEHNDATLQYEVPIIIKLSYINFIYDSILKNETINHEDKLKIAIDIYNNFLKEEFEVLERLNILKIENNFNSYYMTNQHNLTSLNIDYTSLEGLKQKKIGIFGGKIEDTERHIKEYFKDTLKYTLPLKIKTFEKKPELEYKKLEGIEKIKEILIQLKKDGVNIKNIDINTYIQDITNGNTTKLDNNEIDDENAYNQVNGHIVKKKI